MATNKNITMKQFNGVDYDTLYPKTIAAQIDDVYNKNETSNLFLPKAGGSMGGILDMNGNRITNLPTPTSNSEPATKEYVDGWNFGYTLIGTLTSGLYNGSSPTWNNLIVPFNGFKVIEFLFYFKEYTLQSTTGYGNIYFRDSSGPSNDFSISVLSKPYSGEATYSGILRFFPHYIDYDKGIIFNIANENDGASNTTYSKVTMQGISEYKSGSIDIYAKLIT